MKRTPVSSRASIFDSVNAAASIAASTWAPYTASPSWLTLPALPASAAASSGSPGATIAQPSMKIWAPICSATTLLLRAMEPLCGASTPCLRRR